MGGLVLVLVVAYALMLGGGYSTSTADGSAQVAVFYPDSNSWRTFRRGVEACQERGLLRVVEEGGDWVLVRSTDQGRRVRFCWDAALGERELRQHLHNRLNAPNRPVAVVGSINTTLTLTLARELAAWSRSQRTLGPALLVTGATSVEVERSPSTGPSVEPIPESQPLLDVYPGRTFRFCLNNRRLASLVIDYLSEQKGETPSTVFVVVDRYDPFSEDLAAFFDEAISQHFPETPILLREPSADVAPGAEFDEVALAEEIWGRVRQAGADKSDHPVWVMLTTQGEPAERVLAAIKSRGPEEPTRALRLLCGDGVGRSTLLTLARSMPCPMVSSTSNSPRVQGLSVLDAVAQGQIEAEVVSAILTGLNQDPTDLAAALARLSIPAQVPRAIGRSLAFEGGERKGADLGHVLEVQPRSGVLEAHAPGPDRAWSTLRWVGEGWGAEAEPR
ncbi:MAG TPA: hypothetical protein VFT74_18210, partial [Isosphaeraceae bacterium]|nr:hypothetical protein [Isosphaeraceae bacterium]